MLHVFAVKQQLHGHTRQNIQLNKLIKKFKYEILYAHIIYHEDIVTGL